MCTSSIMYIFLNMCYQSHNGLHQTIEWKPNLPVYNRKHEFQKNEDVIVIGMVSVQIQKGP